MDESPESIERSFCKSKGGQQDEKMVARGYIMEVTTLALTSLFYVPKVKDDILMVFDATTSGLNDSLWAPNFTFLSMVSLIMMVGLETHMFNLDFGGVFYSFQLSSFLEMYFGVGLVSYLGYKKDRQGTPLWMLWVSFMVGLVLFPYAAIQVLLWGSGVVMGDRREPNNPFRWDNIKLNLSGEPNYSPTTPWVSKF